MELMEKMEEGSSVLVLVEEAQLLILHCKRSNFCAKKLALAAAASATIHFLLLVSGMAINSYD